MFLGLDHKHEQDINYGIKKNVPIFLKKHAHTQIDERAKKRRIGQMKWKIELLSLYLQCFDPPALYFIYKAGRFLIGSLA